MLFSGEERKVSDVESGGLGNISLKIFFGSLLILIGTNFNTSYFLSLYGDGPEASSIKHVNVSMFILPTGQIHQKFRGVNDWFISTPFKAFAEFKRESS